MSVALILLPVGLVLAALALGACIWALKNGQYDDLSSPQIRMLHDDEPGEGRKNNG